MDADKTYGEKAWWQYTRMLRTVLNKSRRQHPTKQQLYGYLPLIMKSRQTRHVGHYRRSKNKLISDVLLWTPSHRRAKVGRPPTIYQQLCNDTGCSLEDLPRAIVNRDEWQERVREICACNATWWWWWIHCNLFVSKNQTVTQTFACYYFFCLD